MLEPSLRPGDCLLYSGTGFFSTLIKIKTWSRFSHVEIYLGHGQAIASRDGKGVDTYQFTNKNLRAVLRPDGDRLDLSEVLKYHATCLTQNYDWFGLFRFFTLGKQSETKQFCSEYATRCYRKMIVDGEPFKPFAECYDADLVSPGMFYSSPHFHKVWEYVEE